MILKYALFVSTAAAVFAAAALSQQSTPPAPASDALPDGPEPTAAAMLHPNGPTVVMDTSMGRITCQFFQKQAPTAVANFIGLATGAKEYTDPVTKKKVTGKPFFDGTTFHRVIPEFMIQGGDPTGTGMGDPGYRFNDELDPNLNFDVPGRLAMANSGPNSNGSQFFITEQAYDSLNQHYTLFGQCDEASVEVVKTIGRVKTGANDKPIEPVMLKKVTIVPEGQAVPPPAGSGSDVGAPPKRVYISAGVAATMIDHKVTPSYPAEAKAAGVSGVVTLQALIGLDGRIADLHVVSGPDSLQQAALDAVKQWVYKQYLLNGQPVEVATSINVVFTLSK
jgi:peptidyl-prolyl cis-trans isomerase A (cyclophilin A)